MIPTSLRRVKSIVWILLILSGPAVAQSYDLVIAGGRVIDPESKLDAVRSVGITGGKIRAVTSGKLEGRAAIDARGLIVTPGFIDLHAHGQDLENYRAQAMDGVTTALELEVGTGDVDRWYGERAGRSPIHYGASIGHIPVRMQVLGDPGGMLPTGDAARRAATEEEITEIKRRMERGLAQGAPAAGFGIQYTPAASRWEILEMFRVAARFGAACHVHMRHMGEESVAGLEELIAASALTGTPLHLVHVTSSGLRSTPKLLQMIGEAQARGLDVTTECYPYTAAMTGLESAMFDQGWQKVLGIDYQDLEWTQTGERLTAESFARYRKTGGMTVMHMIPEPVVRLAVASPLVMIASDGEIRKGKGHPRASGTFSRVLGLYSRDEQALGWMEALRKMTLAPARRLERRAPMMKDKGRVRVGADADLTLFDPARVRDRATFAEPGLASEGIQYVLVGGVPVVKAGRLDEAVNPGQPVRTAAGDGAAAR